MQEDSPIVATRILTLDQSFENEVKKDGNKTQKLKDDLTSDGGYAEFSFQTFVQRFGSNAFDDIGYLALRCPASDDFFKQPQKALLYNNQTIKI